MDPFRGGSVFSFASTLAYGFFATYVRWLPTSFGDDLSSEFSDDVSQLAWLLVPDIYGLSRNPTALAVAFTSMGTPLGFRLGHAQDRCLELPHVQQSFRLTGTGFCSVCLYLSRSCRRSLCSSFCSCSVFSDYLLGLR
ncbi:hypothetical protein AAG570_010284 [Ranatra chinensis]|uniref:Uncharacterized protein n=1 Tax=Ranatra chinensis TaxID=642074 RepID=A0ABD0Z482_9HEMI